MASFRFAKVIATMWPSISKETILKKIVNYVDIFRINLSYWGITLAERYVDMIRKIDSSKAIMFDTKWPEIRIKNLWGIDISKRKKVNIVFSSELVEDEDNIVIDYPFLDDVKKDVIISIDDNKIVLKVEKITDNWIIAKVLIWGFVKENKSLTFRWYYPKLDFLTEEDKKGILWAIKNNIIFLAVSFVRNSQDIIKLKQFLKANWGDFMKIIAKIELESALEDIDNIVKLSDAIMIARWDLWSVIPLENLTKIQIELIKKWIIYWKPVIVATQVLPTMVSNSMPTRAEVDEVVYNIRSWADVFMLSDETAIGKYPYETLEWLTKIINSNYDMVENPFNSQDLYIEEDNFITDNIIYEAYKLTQYMDIKAIICPTETGYTVRRLSTLKPNVPIIDFTKNDDTFKYLNLLWWVKWFKISWSFDYNNVKKLWKEIVKILLRWNVNIDDKILVVHSSIAQNIPGMINWLEIYKFKDL